MRTRLPSAIGCLLGAVGLMLPALLAPPGPAVAAPPAAVTFPSISRIYLAAPNASYPVAITGALQGTATFSLLEGSSTTPRAIATDVPAGAFDLVAGLRKSRFDGLVRVVVHDCVGAICTQIATSEPVEITQSLRVTPDPAQTAFGGIVREVGPTTLAFTIKPGPVEAVTLSWSMARNGVVYKTGESKARLTGPESGVIDLDFGPLTSGSYTLKLTAASATVADASIGLVSGPVTTTELSFTSDTTPPTIWLSKPEYDGEFYPAPDGYRDTVAVLVNSSDAATTTASLIAPDGRVVRSWTGVGSVQTTWNGLDDSGVLVAPGSYLLRGRAVDGVGNVATAEQVLVVKAGHLEERTKVVAGSPASSMVLKAVGRCADLTRLKSGALRYSRRTNCRVIHAPDDRIVRTVHKFLLPSDAVEFSTASLGLAGRKGTGGKLTLAYSYLSEKFPSAVHYRTFKARSGWQQAPAVNLKEEANYLVGDLATRPYLKILATSRDGAYDVRKVGVKVSYRVLVP